MLILLVLLAMIFCLVFASCFYDYAADESKEAKIIRCAMLLTFFLTMALCLGSKAFEPSFMNFLALVMASILVTALFAALQILIFPFLLVGIYLVCNTLGFPAGVLAVSLAVALTFATDAALEWRHRVRRVNLQQQRDAEWNDYCRKLDAAFQARQARRQARREARLRQEASPCQ
jgi:hypothetical protein